MKNKHCVKQGVKCCLTDVFLAICFAILARKYLGSLQDLQSKGLFNGPQ